MQQNVQSQQHAQQNQYSRNRNSNLSKIQQSQKLIINNEQKEQEQNWQAIYVDGKYYLTDKKSFLKLQQIENQIKKQKNIIKMLKNKKQTQNEHNQYDQQNQQKSYYSLNENQNDQLGEDQHFDTKTQVDMSILEDRKYVAIKQLEMEEEKYRENIRKTQLKRTQIKRKLMEEKEIQIKTMDLKQYDQKKKKNQTIQMQMQKKSQQNYQHLQKQLNEQHQQTQQKNDNKTQSQKLIEISESKPLTKSIITNNNQNQGQKQSSKNHQSIIHQLQNKSNHQSVQQNHINHNDIENNSRVSQKASSSKKYSVKKSTVIVPESNQTLQQIQSRKEQKEKSSRVTQSNKNDKTQLQKQYTYKSLSRKHQIDQSSQKQHNQMKIQNKSSKKQSQSSSYSSLHNSKLQSVKMSLLDNSKINYEKNQPQVNQNNGIFSKNNHINSQHLEQSFVQQSRLTDKKSEVSKKQSVSIKSSSSSSSKNKSNSSNQKIDLMYIPYAPKQPSHKSFKKTDKSIQWSQIDVSNYGKTNIEQSRMQNSHFKVNKQEQIQVNKINMKKNKPHIELNPVVIQKIEKEKTQKSQNLAQSQATHKSRNDKQASVKVKQSQKSFISRSREGSVKQKVERYDKFQRQHSLNQKSLNNNNGKTALQPLQRIDKLGIDIQKGSNKKAASYRSRKSNIHSSGSNAISKSKTIIVKQKNNVGVEVSPFRQPSEFIQNNGLSQIEGTKILVAKQEMIQLHHQIKLLEEKLCKIEEKQENLIKEKNQEINKLEIQVKEVEKQVKGIKNKDNKNISQKEKSQKDEVGGKQDLDEEVKLTEQNNIQVKEVKSQENKQNQQEKLLQNNSDKQILEQNVIQTSSHEDEKLNQVQQLFNEQKIKLLEQISRLKRIIRDLQIQKIKSIDHDKTISSQQQHQQVNNINNNKMQTQSQQFGHIVHQNTINRSQDNHYQTLNHLNRSHRRENLQKSEVSHKSPIGRIVKNNSPQKNQSRVIENVDKNQQQSQRKNNKFRISLSKKASIASQNVLDKNFDLNESRQNVRPSQSDQQFSPKLNKNNQILSSSKSSQFQQVSPSKKSHKNSEITKQQVLEKFHKTNRQFQNFIESSRIINETNSSVSNLSQNNFFTNNVMNRSTNHNNFNLTTQMIKNHHNQISPDRHNANIDQFNPQKQNNTQIQQNFSRTNLANSKTNIQNKSFTRLVNHIKNQGEENFDEIPQIQIRDIQYPKLPQTPTISMNQEQLLELAKQTFKVFDIQIRNQDHDFTMKKYKNCIILTKGIDTILWHYTGKFYMGGWKNKQNGQGQKIGQGIQIIPDKHIYKGQFLNGKKHGTGILKSVNGNIYDGQWIQGVKHGQGVYYDATTKVVYNGEWKQGKKNGFGLLKFSEKQYYQGTFVKSVKDGFGIQVFVNGDRYKGEYRKGKFHGKGKYTWANGSAYEGDFNQGMRHGNGSWKSAKKDGDIYVGTYQMDKKSGFGRYVWANGCTYEGSFSEDVKHGKGKLIYTDGREIKGVWEEGALIQATEQNKKQREQEDPLRKTKKYSLGASHKDIYV